MKKIVFCIVALATMTSGTYASQVFDNPPQKQWGQTRVDESCRDAGVGYNRTTGNVSVYTNNRADANVTVENKDGSSHSKDTRSNWDAFDTSKGGYSDGNIKEDSNVDIKCYPREQK